MDKININDVASVYSGKSNTCYCGCAGTYSYNPDHVEYSSKHRGYAVGPEEVNFKTVRRIVNKLNKNLSDVTAIDHLIFTLQVGNHDYTVYLRDYSEEKKAEELKSLDRMVATKALVEKFNDQWKDSGVVYLKLVDNDSDSFQVHFRLRYPFVDSESYDEGSAIIYPHDSLYAEIQKLAGDRKVQWNNTRTIGWLAF